MEEVMFVGSDGGGSWRGIVSHGTGEFSSVAVPVWTCEVHSAAAWRQTRVPATYRVFCSEQGILDWSYIAVQINYKRKCGLWNT